MLEKGVEKIPTPTKGGIQNITILRRKAPVLMQGRTSKVQKDFVKNEIPKNRGTLDPKGVYIKCTPLSSGRG